MPAASASAAGAAEPAVAEAAGLPEPDELDEPPEPRQRGSNARAGLMKPLVVLALPGMYLFYKYSQYRREQRELSRRRVTERELQHLHHKIDKLLTKLEENEPEMASSQEDERINKRADWCGAIRQHEVLARCFLRGAVRRLRFGARTAATTTTRRSSSRSSPEELHRFSRGVPVAGRPSPAPPGPPKAVY